MHPRDIVWPFPNMNKPPKLFNIGSRIVIPAVGIISKIMTGWLNNVVVYNRHVLIDAIENRPENVPLITVSNHHSCLDDPMLWGILDWKHLFNSKVMRWSGAAHDICFTKEWHSKFFALGKTFPIRRGDGVYQKAMDFCLERLNAGNWIHFFPEGKVNMTKDESLRLKWGIGRLISECKITPFVIPFYHLGMDCVLPNKAPYIPRVGQVVTVLIGNPIDFSEMREKLKKEMKTAMEKRKLFTDIIQEELRQLKHQTENLHRLIQMNKL
ncbi:tafazzin-like isoform X1 [Centruroides sculpturatus]|uniref:tafazzin-like isoform X1 n=1 Tax=Centruroides sculpturatus TaxID=218467 RepID=UPI000C6E5317|nr:tafazzin-like isoform X1 [Centruroides sculpturatus]